MNNIHSCPDCKKTEIIYNFDKGEIVCKNCGLVIEESMPYFEEYREGASKIPTKFIKGNIIREQWLMDSKEKNFFKINTVINFLASKLRLPDYVKNEALKLYKEALYKNFCIGRSSIVVAHACIYLACNMYNLPKTAQETVEYSEVDSVKLLRINKSLARSLDIRKTAYKPSFLLPRFISNLNLSQKTLTRAMIIMNKLEEIPSYSSKNPKSLIAAVIYIAAKLNKEKITQREISNKIEVMEKTIRESCKEIEKELRIIF